MKGYKNLAKLKTNKKPLLKKSYIEDDGKFLYFTGASQVNETSSPHKCSCIDRLSELDIAKIYLGNIHVCSKCIKPVFLDVMMYQESPLHYIIRYGNKGSKFALILKHTLHKVMENTKEQLNDYTANYKQFCRARFED